MEGTPSVAGGGRYGAEYPSTRGGMSTGSPPRTNGTRDSTPGFGNEDDTPVEARVAVARQLDYSPRRGQRKSGRRHEIVGASMEYGFDVVDADPEDLSVSSEDELDVRGRQAPGISKSMMSPAAKPLGDMTNQNMARSAETPGAGAANQWGVGAATWGGGRTPGDEFGTPKGKAPRKSTNEPEADGTPLAIGQGAAERISALGPEMNAFQKTMLWVGLALDLLGKASLLRELARLSKGGHGGILALVIIFLILSCLLNTAYWLAHYNWEKPTKADRDVKSVFGLTKADMVVLRKRIGAIFAFFGFGTFFAAVRALRAKSDKQRAALFEVRGLRFADTVLLTLSVGMLNMYMGIRCEDPSVPCPSRGGGFDTILFFAVIASLVSATLCYITLDVNDHRLSLEFARKAPPLQLMWIVTFFCFRITELASRAVTYALFAATVGGWVFMMFAFHVVGVVACMWFVPGPHPGRQFLTKTFRLVRVTPKKIPLIVPRLRDSFLVFLAIVWPPSCYVADPTDRVGAFWWDSQFSGRRRFFSLNMYNGTVVFPVYLVLATLEYGIMVGIMRSKFFASWNARFVEVSLASIVLWLLSGLVHTSLTYMFDSKKQPEASKALRASRTKQEQV